MLFAAPLSLEEIKTLEEMHKNHWNPAPRTRSLALLLSAQGFKIKNLAEIFSVCRQTVATWLHDWEDGGICGLFDLPRCGRPRILVDEAKAIEYVNLSPRSLKAVLAELAENFNLNLSHSTLKRACKRAKLTWKRVRKSLKSKRDTALFEKSRQHTQSWSNKKSKASLIGITLTNQDLHWNLAFPTPGNLSAKR